jgi:hypothetical protein
MSQECRALSVARSQGSRGCLGRDATPFLAGPASEFIAEREFERGDDFGRKSLQIKFFSMPFDHDRIEVHLLEFKNSSFDCRSGLLLKK